MLAKKHGGVSLPAAAFWRVALAVLPLFLFRFATGPKKPEAAESVSRIWLFLPGLFFAGDLFTWHLAFRYTSVANATLLANVATILVSLYSYFFLKERFSSRFIAGTITALLGVVLLVTSTTGRSFHIGGDFLALGTAFFYAAYMLAVKRARVRYDVMTVLSWTCLSTAVVLLPLMFVAGGPILSSTMAGWGFLLALALLCHAGGQGLIVFAMRFLPASYASVALLLQPVGTAIWGWLLLDQSITGLQAVGGVAVLIGIGLALRARPG